MWVCSQCSGSCWVECGEGMLVGKRVDLKIRKETLERAMSSVVRCFRDEIIFRKQDFVEKVEEHYRKERDGSGLVDASQA